MSNNKTVSFLRFLLFTILFAAFCGNSVLALDDELASLVRSRQERTQDVAIHYHVKSFMAKGYIKFPPVLGSKSTDPSFPDSDTTLEYDNVILLKNDKIRYENKQPIADMKNRTFSQKQEISVINVDGTTILYPNGLMEREVASGIRLKDSQIDMLKSPTVCPIMMHFRGLNASVSLYNLGTLTRLKTTLPIQGQPCQVFIHDNTKGRVTRFCFDMGKGGILRQMTISDNERLSRRTEIQYGENQFCGPTPISWVVNEFDASGNTVHTVNVIVTKFECSANNKDDEFNITFPRNIDISDEISGEEYHIDSQGNKRFAPSSRKRDQIGSGRYQTKIVLSLLLISFTLILVYRVYRKKSRPSPPSPPTQS